MVQVLMSQKAHARVRDRLPDGVTVATVSTEGVIDPPDASPKAFWFSLDLYADGGAPAFFGALLKGEGGEWMQSFSAGLDSPAFRMVMQKGLRITKSDAQAPAIAEYVLAHALSLLHPIGEHRKAQGERDWRRIPFREVADTHWLLVGFGNIGREVAARLKPFGAKVTAVRRRAGDDPLVDAVIAADGLPAVLPDVDVVVLAPALTDETRDMIDEAFLSSLKPGAILINVGRGELVVDEALKAALDDGRLAFAVLDVFRTEPLPGDDWRWSHPKVRVTAHDSNAGSGLEARGDAIFLENLNRYLSNSPLRNEAEPREVGL